MGINKITELGPIDDIYIEAGFQNLSDEDVNNLSLICRFSDQGWYEFRLLRSGEWQIWKFITGSGYIRLDDARAPRLYGDTPSTVSAMCSGQTLTIFFNGQPATDSTVTDADLIEGAAGLSVFTVYWDQAAIEIDYFGAGKP